MGIEKNKMVTLTYDLKIDDNQGDMIEQATRENPLKFLFGAGIMLPKFESCIEKYSEGENFEILLNKHEAYGEVNRDAIVDLPKNVFIVDMSCRENNFFWKANVWSCFLSHLRNNKLETVSLLCLGTKTTNNLLRLFGFFKRKNEKRNIFFHSKDTNFKEFFYKESNIDLYDADLDL